MDMALIYALAGLAVGVGGGFAIKKTMDTKKTKSAEAIAQEILTKAKEQAAVTENQARNRARNIEQAAAQTAEKDARRREQEAKDLERRAREKDEAVLLTELEKLCSYELGEGIIKREIEIVWNEQVGNLESQ